MLKKILVPAIALGAAFLVPVCGYAQTVPAPAPAANQPQPGQKSEYVFVKAYRSNVDPEKYQDSAKAADLMKQREKLVKELHEARRRVIKEDPRAAKIQSQIRALLDEMTLVIEGKESVKQTNRKLKKVDDELDALPLKGAADAAAKKTQDTQDKKDK